MRKLILITVVLLAGCGPAMTSREKLLFGSMCAAQWADYETTRRCISAGASEMNPLVSDHPSDDSIAMLKIGTVLVYWSFGQVWPEHRESIFTVGTITAGGGALWNNYHYENNR